MTCAITSSIQRLIRFSFYFLPPAVCVRFDGRFRPLQYNQNHKFSLTTDFFNHSRCCRWTSGRHSAGTQLRHADTHPAAGTAVGRARAQFQPFNESRPTDVRVRRRPGRPDAILDDRLKSGRDLHVPRYI